MFSLQPPRDPLSRLDDFVDRHFKKGLIVLAVMFVAAIALSQIGRF